MNRPHADSLRPSLTGNKRFPYRQRGMALVIVLWVIALLGAIAAGHAKNVHSETMLAMQHVESAKARAQAEAGIQHAILNLLLPNSENEWPVNGALQQLNIDNHTVGVAIRDATGLVDLNAADTGLLGALLATTGKDTVQQEKLVAAILDWRDSDNLSHLRGAEDDDYQAAGFAWSARDAAFSSVDELRYVFGMTAERFAAISPYLTVYSRRAGLNLEYASPFLIRAVTGQTVESASNEDGLSLSDGRTLARKSARNGTYHIYSGASGNGGAFASIEAVVNISAAAEFPFAILYWREPARFHFPVKD